MKARAAFGILACVACGHVAPPARPAILASPTAHARTDAERRADTCGRASLVTLEGPVVVGPSAPVDHGLVRSVRVVDLARRPVETGARTLEPIRHDADLEPEAVREAMRRLWREGRFDDVVVETSREGDGVAVVFRVTPKRAIARVFVGAAEDSDVAALGLASGRFYDPVALVSSEHALRDALAKRGHLDATVVVSSAFADADRTAVDVCVRVERGPRVVLEKIDVRKSAFASALAAELAKTDEKNVPGAVLDDDYLERDVLVLSAWLYDRGLLSHKIDKTIERTGDRLTVVLDVTDGPVYRYGSIDVRGDLAAPKAEYMKLVTAKRGDVFSRSQMVGILDAFRALDKSKGHESIEIEPQSELDETTHTVRLSIDLRDAGKLAVVELAPGAGKTASKGDRVTVRYKGMLADGTVFDTSKKHGPFDFVLGASSVIAGFDKGVTGMKVGGKRRVTIPPDMGYGASGSPPTIPANAVLVFEIELVAIR